MKYPPRKCTYCEQEFIPERRNRKFCSDTCKQYNYLTKKTGKKYGVEKTIIETTPLVITEQPETPVIIQSRSPDIPIRIAIIYDYICKSVEGSPPNKIELRKWHYTFTG